ncbi:hypothetical protein KP509_13G057400 [Ceratopteris richardii]|uniref:Uncharacterized protein n=1 Tax=Ceratopteris richardii TaxID=49495 RepID=A0A8T2TJ95_CERRI|nr:hypothetical protein KP509_13G057400 [Ceratopteris richardii]
MRVRNVTARCMVRIHKLVVPGRAIAANTFFIMLFISYFHIEDAQTQPSHVDSSAKAYSRIVIGPLILVRRKSLHHFPMSFALHNPLFPLQIHSSPPLCEHMGQIVKDKIHPKGHHLM